MIHTGDGARTRFNLNKPVPLLFLGDGPDQHTGLARIGRDLALLASSMPEFRVGYIGRNLFGCNKFPFQQYSFDWREQWGEWKLQRAFNDFMGDDLGRGKAVVMTVWDASRLLWFARPEYGLPEQLSRFLQSGEFERWGYFMVDGEGVETGKLPTEQIEVLNGYNRVLIASKWGYELARESGVHQAIDFDWMPHPINGAVFHHVDAKVREITRGMWGVHSSGGPVIGCVMANQARKHWPVVLEGIARYRQRTGKSVRLWLHTDKELNYWNIPALLVEYGLEDCLLPMMDTITDSQMAVRYAACDVTVVVSGGEGFCYPIAESLAVGTPVVAGSYGAHTELMMNCGAADLAIINPLTTQVDTIHNVRRAVYEPEHLASVLEFELNKRTDNARRESIARSVEHLHMLKLGVQWKRWFRQGIKPEGPEGARR